MSHVRQRQVWHCPRCKWVQPHHAQAGNRPSRCPRCGKGKLVRKS